MKSTTTHTNGAQFANLTDMQRATLRLAIRQALVTAWRDEYSVRTIVNGIAAQLDDALAAIVREHRAEVLAEVERRIASIPWSISASFNTGRDMATRIVRDYRQEQNHD